MNRHSFLVLEISEKMLSPEIIQGEAMYSLQLPSLPYSAPSHQTRLITVGRRHGENGAARKDSLCLPQTGIREPARSRHLQPTPSLQAETRRGSEEKVPAHKLGNAWFWEDVGSSGGCHRPLWTNPGWEASSRSTYPLPSIPNTRDPLFGKWARSSKQLFSS